MESARETPATLSHVPEPSPGDLAGAYETGESAGGVQMAEAILLARRMRELRGEALDSEDFQAIAEATGVDAGHLAQIQGVELAGARRNLVANVAGQYRALDSELRKYVASGVWAAATAILWQLGRLADGVTGAMLNSRYGVFQQVALLFVLAGVANAALARTARAGVGAGAIFGAASFLLGSLVAPLLALRLDIMPTGILGMIAVGGIVGGGAQALAARFLGRIQDPKARRRELLNQMAEIQSQLTEGREFVAFLSVDVVGSTRLKMGVPPLQAERTMTEYQAFVAAVVAKYGGRVHNTAGDGTTCAFDDPARAFLAAKNLQLGMPEFNRHRNEIGRDLEIRCGVHSDRANLHAPGERASLDYATVIDVAAHLQAKAPPGGIAVSEAAAALIPGGADAIGAGRVDTDGVPGVLWTPRRTARAGEAV